MLLCPDSGAGIDAAGQASPPADRTRHRQRLSPYLHALRYGILNALMLAFIVALLFGGGWIWLVIGLALFGAGMLDELIGDAVPPARRASRWLYDIELYATLPLLAVITLLDLHYLTRSDPLGLVHGLSRIGIAFGGLPSVRRWPAVAGATFGTAYFYALAGMTVAHELLHRSGSAGAMRVARALLAFNLSGHYPTYHLHGHHRNVATRDDPATARRGEYVLAFLARCLIGEVRETVRIEKARLVKRGLPFLSRHNRLLQDELYGLALLAMVAAIGGYRGFIGFLIAAGLGPGIQRLVDYSQHYGLVRVPGRPVEARHSWECDRFLTDALQYNLGLHADHHLAAGKPYWELRPQSGAPRLPCGYTTASLIALVPPLWRRLTEPLLADWDRRLADDGERALLRQRA
ncbi:MAG TPA: fatty acid desaturase [Candidatus Bathyarchaeia archaeon]|nr:fatty acid desaturase [Candidatus Bathyarchaeia archaeon]